MIIILIRLYFSYVHHVQDPYYKPETLRHTSVIIIPFCEYFDEFSSFENVIGAVTKARRESVDFVINSAIMKKKSSNWRCVDRFFILYFVIFK